MKTLLFLYNLPVFHLLAVFAVFVNTLFAFGAGMAFLMVYFILWAVIHQKGGFWNQKK